MRHTKGHTGNRRSHHALEKTRMSKDKDSGKLHMRHRASLETGSYRGKKVLDVEAPTPSQAKQEAGSSKDSQENSKE